MISKNTMSLRKFCFLKKFSGVCELRIRTAMQIGRYPGCCKLSDSKRYDSNFFKNLNVKSAQEVVPNSGLHAVH